MKYVALLRGINVGGKNTVKMSTLTAALEKHGFTNVRTYINSGNILFESDKTDKNKLAGEVQSIIKTTFKLTIPTVVISADEFRQVLVHVPKNWMKNPEWKYNYIFLKEPYDINEVMSAIGILKPDIEEITVGNGVLYQGLSLKLFGRTTSGKLASTSQYKIMTIRNHNTVAKLVELLA